MSDRVWMTVGEALRKARKNRNWTQSSLALEIGVSRSQIANVERGFTYPSVQTVEEICAVLRVQLRCGPRGWRSV